MKEAMADTPQEQRRITRLFGHSQSVLCCVSSQSSPHVVASSSEDGSVCVFDIRTKSFSQRFRCFGAEEVMSVSLSRGNENMLYAGAGAVIFCLDQRLGPSGSPLQTYTFNTDAINQVVVNQKATYLAAADDSGQVKVIDLQSHKLFKTLQEVHSNICSTVQFHPHRPWEVVTGGLDSKIVKWDFSRGRPLHIVDLSSTAAASDQGVGQICNPPFVHALSVFEGVSSGEAGKLMAAARGDGAVDVFDLSFESKTMRSTSRGKNSKKKRGIPSRTGGKDNSGPINSEFGSQAVLQLHGRKRHLHSGIRGHACAVSHVTFARFGEQGRFVVSGGNDALIKVWDWAREVDPITSSSVGVDDGDGGPLVLDIKHKRKVNWLSTIASNADNLVVADISKSLSIYSIF